MEAEKKAVTLAVYGNGIYGDALLELNDLVKEAGYEIAASATFIAQHSISPDVGIGRPDEKDAEKIKAFAGEILAKLEKGMTGEISVPGNRPYKAVSSMPVAPVNLSSCNTCGKCVDICPTEAIKIENEAIVTDTEKCCLCMACVHACPNGTRILPPPLQEQMDQKLAVFKDVRKEIECYI